MKLLVVSDVHGDLDALERAVDAEADTDAVIFLGDGLREAENLQDMRAEDLQRAGQLRLCLLCPAGRAGRFRRCVILLYTW